MAEPPMCWNCRHDHHDHCHRTVAVWTKAGDGTDRNGAYFPDYEVTEHDCGCPRCSAQGQLW